MWCLVQWFTIVNASWHISLGIADPTHLLPLLTGLVTFVQMRLSQPISPTETKEALAQLSQSMQWLLLLIPVGLTIIIAWQFAAGLALYRFVSLIFTMIEQYFIMGWGSLGTRPVVGNTNDTSSLARQQLIQPSLATKTRRR